MKLDRVVRLEAVEAARRLVGATVIVTGSGSETSVVLTETEAYRSDDPASHSFGGRTRRNASMFGPPGTLYVYLSYGIHWCANISVCAPGSAVLLRSALPRTGIELMEQRRGRSDHLADGPGKLSQALGIDGADDGLNLLSTSRIRVVPTRRPVPSEARTRVGITCGVDRPWRFVSVPAIGD